MSLGVTGAAIPAIVGAGSLVRRAEWWSHKEHLEADGSAVLMTGTVPNLGGLLQTMWRVIAGTTPTSFLANNVTMWDFSTAPAQSRSIAFRPFVNALHSWGWRDVMPALAGTLLPGIGRSPSLTISAWVRKKAAGDATHARRCIGFGNNIALSPSGATPRCGLIGDGALGFRFGSVHCPDGLAAGETAANAIDAGSVQPAELVNPGAALFHVAIKLIPPGPTSAEPGKWAAYLNGLHIKTFDNAAVNFPRGNNGVAQVVRYWEGVEPTIYSYQDAAALVGMLVWDARIIVANEWDVPGTLIV